MKPPKRLIDLLFDEFQVSREALSADMTELAATLLEEKLIVEES
jgi:hypothetical protein